MGDVARDPKRAIHRRVPAPGAHGDGALSAIQDQSQGTGYLTLKQETASPPSVNLREQQRVLTSSGAATTSSVRTRPSVSVSPLTSMSPLHGCFPIPLGETTSSNPESFETTRLTKEHYCEADALSPRGESVTHVLGINRTDVLVAHDRSHGPMRTPSTDAVRGTNTLARQRDGTRSQGTPRTVRRACSRQGGWGPGGKFRNRSVG